MENLKHILLFLVVMGGTSFALAQKSNKISFNIGLANYEREDVSINRTNLLENNQILSEPTDQIYGLRCYSMNLAIERKVNNWLSVAVNIQRISGSSSSIEVIKMAVANSVVQGKFPYNREIRTHMAGPFVYFHFLKKEKMDLKLGLGYYFSYLQLTYPSQTTLIINGNSPAMFYDQFIKSIKEKDSGTILSLSYGINVFKNIDLHCQGEAVFF